MCSPKGNPFRREMDPRFELLLACIMLGVSLFFASKLTVQALEEPFHPIGTPLVVVFVIAFAAFSIGLAYHMWLVGWPKLVAAIVAVTEHPRSMVWFGRSIVIVVLLGLVACLIMGIEKMHGASNTLSFMMGLTITIAGIAGIAGIGKYIYKDGF